MGRRGFLGLLVAAVSGLVRVKEAAGPSYTYDWQTRTTDDPRFAGGKPLPYGMDYVHETFLDGRKTYPDLWVTSLKTGPDGWVEGYPGTAAGPDHKHVILPDGEETVLKVRKYGDVRYEVYKV